MKLYKFMIGCIKIIIEQKMSIIKLKIKTKTEYLPIKKTEAI